MLAFLEIYRWLVYGNFWVAAGAASLYAASAKVLQQPISINWLAGIFFATSAAYTYHRIFRIDKIYTGSTSERHRWIIDQYRILLVFMGVETAVSAIFLYPVLSPQALLWLSPAVLLVLLYVVPIFRSGGRTLRLRDVPYLKTLLIVGVWTIITVFPFGSRLQMDQPVFWILLLHRLIYMTAICIPFDLRDVQLDQFNQVSTFASVWGFKKTLLVCRILLIVAAILVSVAWLGGVLPRELALGMVVSSASTAWVLAQLREDSPEPMYGFWLEGAMLDQYFWLVLFS